MGRANPFEVLAADLGFTEGPTFCANGDLVVTSIDRGHLYAIDSDGLTRRLVNTGGGPNGATEGPDGFIYIAQNGARGPWHARPSMTGGVQACGPDGRLIELSTDPVSPNDLCFGPDGALYVTDPTRNEKRNDGRIWRIDVGRGISELLVSLHWYPNGIGFNASDDYLYLASTGDAQIKRMRWSEGELGEAETYIQLEYGHPDGFAFDKEGNIIIGTVGDEGLPGQVQVWGPSGDLLEVLHPGDDHYFTNVALSEDRRLVVCASDSGRILAVDGWPVAGLPLHPFR